MPSLLKKAMDNGINVIQINLKSTNNGDAYVGGRLVRARRRTAEAIVKACGKDSGKTGKVAHACRAMPTTATSHHRPCTASRMS